MADDTDYHDPDDGDAFFVPDDGDDEDDDGGASALMCTSAESAAVRFTWFDSLDDALAAAKSICAHPSCGASHAVAWRGEHDEIHTEDATPRDLVARLIDERATAQRDKEARRKAKARDLHRKKKQWYERAFGLTPTEQDADVDR